jgi:large subunit ribosomal protein L13
MGISAHGATQSARPAEVERRWYVVDATDQTLGRMATQIATILRGKHKPMFTPSMDCGDFVIVVNAEKLRVTGNKLDDKLYYRYSGYPGGMKKVTLREQLRKHPERVITAAVRGMLPKSLLAKRIIRKLKVYVGPDHPHGAQNPEVLKF